ncbi:MAG: flagellar export chaperone FliS [Phycisphaeraceae bacterium]
MNAQAQTTANPYLRTKVLTAGPTELRLMLYDGAIKFCRQARHALTHRDFEGWYNGLVRAQKIVLELSNSLRPDAEPELYERMSALYNYLYRRLVDANMERETAIVDECLELIEYERETWQLLIKRMANHNAPEPNSAAKQNANPAATAYANTPTRNPLASIGTTPQQPEPSGFSVQG